MGPEAIAQLGGFVEKMEVVGDGGKWVATKMWVELEEGEYGKKCLGGGENKAIGEE